MRTALFPVLLLMTAGQAAAQNPLAIPPLITADTFQLHVAPSTKEFYPGVVTQTYGIGAPYLGPTLELQRGDTARFKVWNELPDITTMHWNGMEVPPVYDGSPPREIAPGESWDVKFKVIDKASVYVYHPHTMDLIGQQVGKGAAGLILVRDPEEAALDLPRTYGVDDFPVVVQDKRFNVAGQFVQVPLGDSILVNGTAQAYLDCPAQVVRLRLLNASTARYYAFGFQDSTVFHVIAAENGLLGAPVPMTRLTLASGERVELLLDLTGREGDGLVLNSYGSTLSPSVPGSGNLLFEGSVLNGIDFPVLQLQVTAPTAEPVTTIPAQLVDVQPWPEASASRVRTKLIEGMGMVGEVGMFTINGQEWDMDVINDTVLLGATEIWEYINATNIAHPMTMHGGAFYVLDRNGMPPGPWEAGPRSVVNVDAGDTVRVIMRFAEYLTDGWPLMYHCHNLAHINRMMWQFIVVDPLVGGVDRALERASVHPVPGDRPRWQTGSPVIQVRVLDLGGRELLRAPGHGRTSGLLDLSTLAPGQYIVQFMGLGTLARAVVVRP
jgi:FtsP/CotA-like multicopper oxidase with cupredoxin domain